MMMVFWRDWLWPAVWMLPENNTYGAWPLSGEIDVCFFFQVLFLGIGDLDILYVDS
jgi:hypothetical protein